MKILSFDVGIKNLAYCLIEVQKDNMIHIIQWDIIDLSQELDKSIVCNYYPSCKTKPCFSYNTIYLCKKHAREKKLSHSKDMFPIQTISSKPVLTLREKCKELNLITDDEHKTLKKIDYANKLKKYIAEETLTPYTCKKSNEISLVHIGKQIKSFFDSLFENEKIDIVLIENQISPIANRMKCIQGMMAQYFIMKDISNIEFVSSSNKLKYFVREKMSYKERKKRSIDVVFSLLDKQELIVKTEYNWKNHFTKNKKKDDLADSFLQIIPYLVEKHNLNLNLIIK